MKIEEIRKLIGKMVWLSNYDNCPPVCGILRGVDREVIYNDYEVIYNDYEFKLNIDTRGYCDAIEGIYFVGGNKRTILGYSDAANYSSYHSVTTTDEVKNYTNSVTIIVMKRPGDYGYRGEERVQLYYALADGQNDKLEFGTSQCEAIGKLLMSLLKNGPVTVTDIKR
jgi:hypothetical protein